MFHRTTRILPLLAPLLLILLSAAPANAGGAPEANDVRCGTAVMYIICTRCGSNEILSQRQTVGEYDEEKEQCFPESRVQNDLAHCSRQHDLPMDEVSVRYKYGLNGYEVTHVRPKNCASGYLF